MLLAAGRENRKRFLALQTASLLGSSRLELGLRDSLCRVFGHHHCRVEARQSQTRGPRLPELLGEALAGSFRAGSANARTREFEI